jgi:hypothetical protein
VRPGTFAVRIRQSAEEPDEAVGNIRIDRWRRQIRRIALAKSRSRFTVRAFMSAQQPDQPSNAEERLRMLEEKRSRLQQELLEAEEELRRLKEETRTSTPANPTPSADPG